MCKDLDLLPQRFVQCLTGFKHFSVESEPAAVIGTYLFAMSASTVGHLI